MRLLIDMSSINSKNHLASVSSYIEKMVDSFYKGNIHNIELFANKSQENRLKKKYPKFTIHTIKRNYILYRFPFISDWYSRISYKKALSKINCDVVIIASDQDRGTTAAIQQKKVVVIHDLKGIKTSCSWTNQKNKTFYQKLINQASVVVTISEFTKKDVLANLCVPESKIQVIYNSVQISETESKPQDLPSKYILYVNTLQPYKNIKTLIEAYAKTKASNNLKLVVVGKRTPYWTNQIKPLLTKYKIQNKVFRLQDLSRDELNFVYKNASLFVTTSLHEGFGYTPIEAAIHRAPVISSTCEALPDTTQGLLNYYEPAEDHIALAKKIDSVLDNPPSAESLNLIANKYKNDYSPEKQAEQFLALIKNLI